MTQPRSAPVAALVAMILIWGYSWVVMKIALRHAHPFDFAAIRVAIGCVLLFAIVKVRGRSLALPDYRMAFLLGLLQVALFVGLSHFALLQAGPGKTSVLVFTMPFWMIVFASAGLRSSQSASHSLQAFCTKPFMSVLPSLVLVWPSNCGLSSFTETIAAKPHSGIGHAQDVFYS